MPHASVGVTRAHIEPIAARHDLPLDTFIRGSQRFPLRFGESEEREQLVTAFAQTRQGGRFDP